MIALLLALGAQDLEFDTLLLEAGARADSVVFRDLDDDGRPEILVLSGRDLHVFSNGNGRPAPKPAATLRLDPGVFLWTLAPLDHPKRPSLLTQGARGLQAHSPSDAGFAPPRDLVVHPTLFDGVVAEGHPPLLLDFAPDLERDGRPELLVFQKTGFWVMAADAAGAYRCRQKLALPIDVESVLPFRPQLRMSEKSSFPVFAFGDLSGEGRNDLGVYRDEAILIFPLGPDGLFRDGKGRDLGVEKLKPRNRRYFHFDLPPRILDLDGDKMLDVALDYPGAGRVQLYYARAGRTDFTQPDDVLVVADGWSTGTYYRDLDGDGRLDLVMGVIKKIGILEGIQIFVSGKIDLELHIYPGLPTGRFAKEPAEELLFSIPFACQVTRESAMLDLVFRPNFEGDFDGDGRRDMLVHGETDTLRVHRGVPDTYLAKEPGGAIKMAPPPGVMITEPFVADLNADGRADLLLRHRSVPPAPDVLELKLSRKP